MPHVESFCNPVADILVYCVVSNEDAAQLLECSDRFQLNATQENVQAGMHLRILPTTRTLVFCMLQAICQNAAKKMPA